MGLRGVALAAIGLLLVVGAAAAHQDGGMTYPTTCCHQMDCAPAENVKVFPFQQAGAYAGFFGDKKPPSVTIITTKHGTAAVSPNTTRYESKDNRMHACIRCPEGAACYMNCVFFPPGL